MKKIDAKIKTLVLDQSYFSSVKFEFEASDSEMRRHSCTSRRRSYETDMDSDSDAETLRCISCHEDYDTRDAGTCKECYEEANETEEDLKREIDDLKAKVAFLRFWAPIDSPNYYSSSTRFHPPCFSDVILVASEDTSGGPTAPVPAHKAVLVSTQFVDCRFGCSSFVFLGPLYVNVDGLVFVFVDV